MQKYAFVYISIAEIYRVERKKTERQYVSLRRGCLTDVPISTREIIRIQTHRTEK